MKQGTDYQILLSEITKQLTPEATVLSPEYIRGVNSKRKREIDISVRFKKGFSEIFVMIEVRDRTRPCDIGYIEQLKPKREDVKADKVIVICKRGFSKTAKEYAQSVGIDLLEFDCTPEMDWKKYFSITEVDINEKILDIESVDVVLGEGEHLPKIDGVIETKDTNQFEFYDKDGQKKNSSILDLIHYNIQRDISLYEKIFTQDLGAIWNIEFRLKFELFTKVNDVLYPVKNLKAKLRCRIEKNKTPILSTVVKNLKNSFTGELISRYTEFDFGVKGERISIGLVQNNNKK
jgi:hypothetical protein